MAAAIGRGAFGDLVGTLQIGLKQSGYYSGGIDGDFGGGTELAVQRYQVDHRLRRTGTVNAKLWSVLTGTPWPDLFRRCLQITARFEGHGYTTLAGNFDGAGLTWGIIGFTLKHGEIQAIVNETHASHPEIVNRCFGDRAQELLTRCNSPIDAALMAWADSISAGAKKCAVQEPWLTGFAKFGNEESVRRIQLERARSRYFEPAVITSRRVQVKGELSSDFGIALCFDIHVQNGGVDDAEFETYRRKLASLGKKPTDSDRRLLLARIVADNSRAQYRDDVFSRKATLATGAGLVHGQLFNLRNWGLSDRHGPTRSA